MNAHSVTTFIECQCGDPRDSVIVHRFVGNTHLGWEPELYMDSFMSEDWPWYKRIPHAIRYLFGREAKKYGHYGCTLIGREDAERLMDVCRGFCAEYDAYALDHALCASTNPKDNDTDA